MIIKVSKSRSTIITHSNHDTSLNKQWNSLERLLVPSTAPVLLANYVTIANGRKNGINCVL